MLLNEIAREFTSILHLDELLKHIAELVARLIDYQMFSILLLDSTGEKLQHRFSCALGKTSSSRMIVHSAWEWSAMPPS